MTDNILKNLKDLDIKQDLEYFQEKVAKAEEQLLRAKERLDVLTSAQKGYTSQSKVSETDYLNARVNQLQNDLRLLTEMQSGNHARHADAYQFVSTKEYHDAFPCAYRQWRADSHCNMIHGYSFSMKFYFGANQLDARNWCADYGGLKELKKFLEDKFDHTLLVAADDPELETFKLLQEKKMAKLTVLPKLGCEGLADMLYKYVNAVYIPEMWGPTEAERLWCWKVEVRETQANMAYREGHRSWGEDLFEGWE